MKNNILDDKIKKLYSKLLKNKKIKTIDDQVYTSLFGETIKLNVEEFFQKSTLVDINKNDLLHYFLWFMNCYETDEFTTSYKNINYLIKNDVKHIYRDILYSQYMKNKLKEHQDNDLINPNKVKKLKILSKIEFEKKLLNDIEFSNKYSTLDILDKPQFLDFGGYVEMVEIKNEKHLKNSNTSIINKLGWENVNFKGINQLDSIIDELISNPHSNYSFINFININELEDSVYIPNTNNIIFYTEILDLYERFEICKKEVNKKTLDDYIIKIFDNKISDYDLFKKPLKLIKILNKFNIPEYKLSMSVNFNRIDAYNDLPFNISFYNLMLSTISQIIGMKPFKLIFNLGEVYYNINDKIKIAEVLDKEKKYLPILKLNKDIQDIYEFRIDDIKII